MHGPRESLIVLARVLLELAPEPLLQRLPARRFRQQYRLPHRLPLKGAKAHLEARAPHDGDGLEGQHSLGVDGQSPILDHGPIGAGG